MLREAKAFAEMSGFFDNFRRLLVVAQGNELGMAEMVAAGPFKKFDLSDEQGAEPNSFFHFIGGEAFPPTGFMGFREIDERACVRLQRAHFLKKKFSAGGNETVADASHVDQIFSFVIADGDGVEALWAWREAADDEFLAVVEAKFNPGSGSLPRFVHAILKLADNAFEILFLGGGQQVMRVSFDRIDNCYSV